MQWAFYEGMKLSINTEDKVTQPKGGASQRHVENPPPLATLECRMGLQEVA